MLITESTQVSILCVFVLCKSTWILLFSNSCVPNNYSYIFFIYVVLFLYFANNTSIFYYYCVFLRIRTRPELGGRWEENFLRRCGTSHRVRHGLFARHVSAHPFDPPEKKTQLLASNMGLV